MKDHSLVLRAIALGSALAMLAGSGAALHAEDSANDSRQTNAKPGLAPASQQQPNDQSASRVIGQDVTTLTGESLGQVKDLVIETGAGKIVHALVASGGLLGVGQTIHAVPFAALRPGAKNNFTLNVERADWDSLPVIGEHEIDLLTQENRGRPIFERFGLDWEEEMRSGRGLLTGLISKDEPIRLMRVTQLSGQHVVNAGQEVGTIEEVLVNVGRRRASIVLDPNDDYTGTNQKFIIAFNQLMPSLDAKDRLSTPLTRAEFAKATPLQEDWWTVTGGYPYVWSGDGTIATSPYATTAMERRGREENAARTAANPNASAGRPSVTLVRGALRMDPDLRPAASDVTIEQEGETLVLAGTVRSEKLKEKIGEKVGGAAPGWRVENRLTVQAAAE
jgi:sporulation protein YlmC with PRC-barrel domain